MLLLLRASYHDIWHEVLCFCTSMICNDIWHKYHEWYFTIETILKYHKWYLGYYLFTTTHKRFVIFTRRYFKLSWNTTDLSQSNCKNFSCSSNWKIKNLLYPFWGLFIFLFFSFFFGSILENDMYFMYRSWDWTFGYNQCWFLRFAG